ncbi:MAG TPA: hypothetical protein VJ400_08595 [Thermoplasmata archaeon]|nr:hypothetical protein [Thermoplasmata archaeon]
MATFEQVLCGFLTNPLVYFLIVFLFSIAIAIVLPIPVEIALVLVFFRSDLGLFMAAVFAVASGKAVGAWLVFWLGLKVEAAMHRWSQRSRIIERIMNAFERFVRVTGTFGMFVLLSIPFMSDTAVLYFYALFNAEGHTIDRRRFILCNFLAGISRVSLFFILALTIFPWLIGPPVC